MPAQALDDLYDYDQKFLADILKSVKTIAMVGASADKTKFSYGVLRVLHEELQVVGVFSDWPATTTFFATCLATDPEA